MELDPVATIRISKRTVDAIGPCAKSHIVYDSDLKGFGVRVTPSGLKSYVVEYRPGAGGRGVAKKRITIGPAKTLTPEEATLSSRALKKAPVSL